MLAASVLGLASQCCSWDKHPVDGRVSVRSTRPDHSITRHWDGLAQLRLLEEHELMLRPSPCVCPVCVCVCVQDSMDCAALAARGLVPQGPPGTSSNQATLSGSCVASDSLEVEDIMCVMRCVLWMVGIQPNRPHENHQSRLHRVPARAARARTHVRTHARTLARTRRHHPRAVKRRD